MHKNQMQIIVMSEKSVEKDLEKKNGVEVIKLKVEQASEMRKIITSFIL